MIEQIREAVWVPSEQEIQQEKEWILQQIEEIGVETLTLMIEEAVEVKENAYIPESKYKVGASILSVSGKTFKGCNSEVRTLTGTIHAEAAAISRAIGDGEIVNEGKDFIRAVIVSHEGESAPCGGCLVIIGEHCDNALIIDVDEKGNVQRTTSLKTVNQYSF